MKPYESRQKSEKSSFAYLKVLTHRINARKYISFHLLIHLCHAPRQRVTSTADDLDADFAVGKKSVAMMMRWVLYRDVMQSEAHYSQMP